VSASNDDNFGEPYFKTVTKQMVICAMIKKGFNMATISQFFPLRNLLAAALLAAALNAHGQAAPQKHEIAIGQRAPSFTLKDQNDREISLDALLKKGPVAAVFIRSVEWCVYCQFQAIELQRNLKQIEAGGGQVVIITYDAPEKVKRFTEKHQITFPILSDPGSKTIEAYAMRSIRGAGDQAGASQHGTFVIDQKGIVRSKPYLTSFEEQSVVDALVNTLREAKQVEGGAKL
jgi:peroxiredoxin